MLSSARHWKSQKIMEIKEIHGDFDFLSLGRGKPFINITKIATFRLAENQ